MLIACLQFLKFCPVLDEIWYSSGKLVVTYTAIKQENNVIKNVGIISKTHCL